MIKILGLVLITSLMFVLVVGCQGGQNQVSSSENPPAVPHDQQGNSSGQQSNSQAKSVSGPTVLFFTAEW